MGVRLYPISADPDTYENLARVPFGTNDRLQVMKSQAAVPPDKFMKEADGDTSYARYLWINSDEACGKLDHFMMEGYGKFSYAFIGDNICGEETDPIKAKAMYLTATNMAHFDLDPAGVQWG